MNKKHLIGYPVAVILAMTIGAAGATGSSNAAAPVSTVTVAGPAPAPVTVTQAPAECGTALDFAAQFMTAISTEHTAMGAAFTKAGKDGDVTAMASAVTAAVTAANDTITTITTPMTAAAQVCRAAIK
jgi:hypothetical protein